MLDSFEQVVLKKAEKILNFWLQYQWKKYQEYTVMYLQTALLNHFSN